MDQAPKNPEHVHFEGETVPLEQLLEDHKEMRHQLAEVKNKNRKAVVRRREEQIARLALFASVILLAAWLFSRRRNK